MVRLPDADQSAAVLFGRPDSAAALAALAAALTDPGTGGFLPERCRIIDPSDEAEVLPAQAAETRDTLFVYIAGAEEDPSFVQHVANELSGSAARVRILIVDSSAVAAIEGVFVLTVSSSIPLITLVETLIGLLRNGVPTRGELLSLTELTRYLRIRLGDDSTQRIHLIDNSGVADALALTRNAAALPDLESLYSALGDGERRLLRRASLLAADEPLDQELAVLLTALVPVEPEMAALADGGWLSAAPAGHMLLNDPDRREFAAAQCVAEETPETIERLRTALRRHRAVKVGIAPKPKLARDYWTVEDLLNYRAHADAVAAFIRHRDSRPPLTIGVKGRWGAGKTSFMRMVRAELDPPRDDGRPAPIELTKRARAALAKPRRRPHRVTPDTRVTNSEVLRHTEAPALDDTPTPVPLTVKPPGSDWRATVWFNPWTYQSTEQVWAGLASAIIGQVTDRLRPGDRERFWLELNLARTDRLAIRRRIYRLMLERVLPLLASFAVATAFAAVLWATGIARELASWLLAAGASVIAAGTAIRCLGFRGQQAATGFSHLLSGPVAGVGSDEAKGLFDAAFPDQGYVGKAGFLHLVQSDMARVLKLVATEDQPLVVFIDDLDRCSPGVVAQVIEAVNLFLAGEFENCVFVLAMEPDVIAAHVELAYSGLVDKLGLDKGELGWRFLEKIVQLSVSLPAINEQQDLPGYYRALLGMDPMSEPLAAGAVAADRDRILQYYDVGTVPILTAISLVPSSSGMIIPTPFPVMPEVLISQAEKLLLGHRPSLDSVSDFTGIVEQEIRTNPNRYVFTPPGGHVIQWLSEPETKNIVRTAADRVYTRLYVDQYSDAQAFEAIKAALPALIPANPREIKRYVNLFRFYTFISFRYRTGDTVPEARQIAKVAALAIRWPDLLTTLSRDHAAGLIRLEEAAGAGDEEWDSALAECECLTAPSAAGRRAALRAFLSHEPKIGGMAHMLL